ncbi:hypothetical protein [Prochlorococcus sp. ALOHA_ZT_50]|jgi:hypothetical protein|uniref:hypothetical protein n=1 Tax=Prochlorococcus sp. ALOHA_ZT_50 TaxID=2919303 RepID=UPI00257A1776|nr:hypothetical protein [Prochlorococcus sp. ALOHA_ZT_50]MCH2079594.1 hypothetical protein [Prochlorococcus sp. ALOHA_ZT_50]
MKVTIIKPNKTWSEKTVNKIADKYENCIVGERKYDKSEVYTVDLQEVYYSVIFNSKSLSRFDVFKNFLILIGGLEDLDIRKSSFIQEYKSRIDLG